MRAGVSFRAHAGDSEGFLEDGLAGEHGLNRHGYKSGGSGKGEFIMLYNLCVSAEVNVFDSLHLYSFCSS